MAWIKLVHKKKSSTFNKQSLFIKISNYHHRTKLHTTKFIQQTLGILNSTFLVLEMSSLVRLSF